MICWPFTMIVRGAVVIKGAVPGHIDRAAVDDDVPVGIDADRVAGTHDHDDIAAVDFHGGCVGAGFLRRVDAVVAGLDIEDAAVDLDVGAFDALGGLDGDRAAVDLHRGSSMDAVVARLDGQAAAADIDETQGVVVPAFGVQAVRPGGQVQDPVRNTDGVVGLKRFGTGFDGISSACDFQIILAHDAAAGGACP